MIDEIIVPSAVHYTSGFLVVLIGLITLGYTGYLAIKKRPITALGMNLTRLLQVALAIQAMIGIKLLDQGMGTYQLYIHYVGGFAPLSFYWLLYWFPPKDEVKHARWLAIATLMAFLFIFMTFTIGGKYANGEL